jgi:transposase-like protein
VAVPAYERLREDPKAGARVAKATLKGVSNRNYKEVVTGSLEAVGMSKSSVSREFVKETAARVEDLMNRPLAGRMLAVMLDGVRFGDHLIVGAVGVSESGAKQVLGVAQGSTENAATVKSLLISLKDRGLSGKTLFIVDGAKALRAAVDEVFGQGSPVQRCRFHKMKNVLDRLPKTRAGYVGAAMRAAYKLPHEEGMRRMKELAKELDLTHPGAAGSLREGLEETFTVNRLGLPALLRASLGTTNAIESAHSALRMSLGRFKNRSQGSHVLRWVCSAFLEAEKNMRTVKGHKDLWMLRAALDEEAKEMTG